MTTRTNSLPQTPSASPSRWLSHFSRTTLSVIFSMFIVTGAADASLFTIKGSGTMLNETKNVGAFNQIKLDTGARVLIRQGSQESVDIEADDNIAEYVSVVIRGDTLVIEDQRVLKSDKFRITIYVKNLRSIASRGSTTVNADALTSATLNISAGGSSTIGLESLKADALRVDLGGSSVVRLGGTAAALTVGSGGSTVLSAEMLTATKARVQSGGSSLVRVWVIDELTAASGGSSNIRFKGAPKLIRAVAGSSSIEPLQ